MLISRRRSLGLIGGGIIVAASASAGLSVMRSPRTAHSPWIAAGSYEEPRRRALSFALLAPNPHNRQPWLVDLSQEGEAVLYVDRERLLPHTDPFNRQITVGMGCFIELMRMAAAEDGYRVETDLFPEGEDAASLDGRPVARARFIMDPDVKRDPLFTQVAFRRSLKEPYDIDRPVPDALLDQIAAVAQSTQIGATNNMTSVGELRDLSTKAFEIEFGVPRTLKESVDLFRIGAAEVDANPDGIDFSGPMFETLRMTGLFTREASLDPESIPSRSAIDMVRNTMQTGMAYIWQITPGNSRSEQIRSGQDWVRLNLAATSLGIGLQPLSQALQEFPEMADLYGKVHKVLAPEGGTVQMWGRLGYGPTVPPSPRWPLENKIVRT